MTPTEKQAGHSRESETPTALANYSIQGGLSGFERLQLLSRAMAPSTLAFLRKAGLKEGMRCLDVACGGGFVSVEMARIVGLSGQVTGIDLDSEIITLAQQHHGAKNLQFRVSSGLDISAMAALGSEAPFDFVYARFFLSHLEAPLQAITAMKQVLRPGTGVLAVEDIDFSGIFTYPACPAFERYTALYQSVVRARGGDPCLGPRLPDLLESAGFTAIELSLAQPIHREGECKFIAQSTLHNIGPALIGEGLSSEAELQSLAAELAAFANRPDTLISQPRIFQVWSRLS